MILPKPLAQTARCGNRGVKKGSGAWEEHPELGESGDAARVWLILKISKAFQAEKAHGGTQAGGGAASAKARRPDQGRRLVSGEKELVRGGGGQCGRAGTR